MKMKLLLFAGLIIGSVGLSFLVSPVTNAQSPPAAFSNPIVILAADTPPVTTPNAGEEVVSTCRIEAIGWIICPVVKEMAKVVDGAYLFVSSLLEVQPLVSTGAEANVAIYNAWTVMRNFANIAFVIAFMLIIFSQLTSVGLNNYGIKKMLPRLIIAAILVNASFWICAVAVDISNILGASLRELFKGIPTEATGNGLSISTGGPNSSTGNGWEGIAGLVLVSTGVAVGVLYATLSALLPALLAAIIAIVTVFLVLTLRQALIILLIVISPLAFVAYLLPNTESLFKKWLGLFKTLLLMYPIIAMLFGASALASAVVMQSVSEDNPYRVAIQIMGALISIIPLALTPIVMKTAGGVLNRFGGMVNNPNKGPVDGLRKRADAFKGRRQAIANTRRINGTNMLSATSDRYSQSGNRFKRGAGKAIGGAAFLATPGSKLNSKIAKSNISTELKNENANKALTETRQKYVADRVRDDPEFARTIAGPTGNVARIDAAAVTALKNAIAEEIANAQKSVDVKPGKEGMEEVGNKFAEAVRGGDSVTARAMQNILLTSGSVGLSQYRKTMSSADVENNLDPDSEMGQDLRKNVLNNHSGVKATANDLMQQAITGEKMSKVSLEPGTWNMSDAELIGQKPASLEKAFEANAIDRTQAIRIIGNEELAQHLDKTTRAEFSRIAGINPNNQMSGATQPTQSPVINVQPATPGTLNITHTQPATASPGNYRTTPPPNTGNFSSTPGSNGLYMPNNNPQPPANPPSTPPNP
jgi:hypothetical protein